MSRRWVEKIDLNGVIRQMDQKHDLYDSGVICPDEVKQAIADELNKSTLLNHFASRILAAVTTEQVNNRLDAVFHAADRMGVWCGV